jgi:hypothetical protein
MIACASFTEPCYERGRLADRSGGGGACGRRISGFAASRGRHSRGCQPSDRGARLFGIRLELWAPGQNRSAPYQASVTTGSGDAPEYAAVSSPRPAASRTARETRPHAPRRTPRDDPLRVPRGERTRGGLEADITGPGRTGRRKALRRRRAEAGRNLEGREREQERQAESRGDGATGRRGDGATGRRGDGATEQRARAHDGCARLHSVRAAAVGRCAAGVCRAASFRGHDPLAWRDGPWVMG